MQIQLFEFEKAVRDWKAVKQKEQCTPQGTA